MGHVPHLWVPGPWVAEQLDLSNEQRHHLDRVLRLESGEQASYTDGEGLIGTGSYETGQLIRGEEAAITRPSDLIVVTAPPDSRDRARFLVEKLAEMGIAELWFLETRHGQGRHPGADRARSWAISGLEQSRGGWLMTVANGLVGLSDLTGPYVVCDPAGSRERPHARTVVIGPEGGWAPGEIPEGVDLWDLGETVLRVETAALVAAARLS